jgi:TM2 domain-containing membrane protein YozV
LRLLLQAYRQITSTHLGETTMAAPETNNKKIVAGILGLLLGGLGIHKFYLGYTKEGIIQIVLTICSCGILGWLGIIEGILYLTKSDDDFEKTYITGKKGWF